MDLAYLLRRACTEYARRTAVSDGTRSLSFRELGDRSSRLANALTGLGLRRGDRVAVLLRNRLEFAEVDVALATGGFVRVALNARLGLEDFSYCVADSGARALITEEYFDPVAGALVEQHDLTWVRMAAGPPANGSHDYQSLLDEAQATHGPGQDLAAEPAWFSYTSGTTGRPKAVVLSHRALASVVFNTAMELGPTDASSSMLLPQALSHGAGYFQLTALATGSTSYVMDQFDPERAIALGERHGIQTLKLVPTMLTSLVDLQQPVPFSSVIYGASPINPRALDRALDLIGPRLIQIYGQSEAPVTITVLRKHEHVGTGPERFSAGRPWRTVQTQIVDEAGQELGPGEAILRAPQMMDGYHGLPDETADVVRDGWLWTKDMAKTDEQGFIYLLGRRDQMINSGGFNIAPAEVEGVLAQHASVKECVAFGVPDERWGQAVAAVVVATGSSAVDAAELIDFCRAKLGFRRPQQVSFVEALPYSAYGKVDRPRLMEMLAEGIAVTGHRNGTDTRVVGRA